MSGEAVQTPIDSPHGALSRCSRRLAGARSLATVRLELGELVDRLFGPGTRFGMFAFDERSEPVPILNRPGAGLHLLATVRARLLASHDLLNEPHVLPASEAWGHGSIMTAPLAGAGGTLAGVLVVEAVPGAPDFGPAQVVALEGVAALAALGLREPGTGLWNQERVRNDQAAARRVQRGFMSSTLPPGIGVSAHVEYLPALHVGGDFYSLKALADGGVAAAVGDVSGHGVCAALVMARVVQVLEKAMGEGAAPSSVLSATHRRLTDLPSEMFVTASCVRIDTRSRKMLAASAGHPPLVIRRANGDVLTHCAATGAPLAVLDGEYRDEELSLERGDIVLLVTDGLLEALDHPSGQRGMETLLTLVGEARHEPVAIHQRIRTVVDRARGRHEVDDVTWVQLQLER